MTWSLRAQPVERDVGFPGDIAGCNKEPGEHQRREAADDQQPAIE